MTYMERVLKAVHDEDWQAFRVSLKGKSTEEKLNLLEGYWLVQHAIGSAHTVKYEIITCAYCIRVDNYIKALCRGGQLYPGESLERAIKQDWQIAIKS